MFYFVSYWAGKDGLWAPRAAVTDYHPFAFMQNARELEVGAVECVLASWQVIDEDTYDRAKAQYDLDPFAKG